MARRPFGGGAADYVYGSDGHEPTLGVFPVTLWTTETGGSQLTDIVTIDNAPITTLTTDAQGRIPRFQGPADGTGVMWADGGGPHRSLLITTDLHTRILALETNVGTNTFLDITQPSGRDGLTIKGNADNVISNLELFKDFQNAPIGGVQNAGGLWMNDQIRTAWDYAGNEYFKTNIYGDLKIGNVNFAAGKGAPGNQLQFTTACLAQFEGNRLPTAADWTPYSACTVTGISSGGPSATPPSPDGFNCCARMTATGANVCAVTSPGGIYAVPVNPGATRSAMAAFKAVVTPRLCYVILKFFTSGFTYLSAEDIVSTPASSSTSAWTTVAVSGTVPATAAFVVLLLQADTSAANEQHDFAAVGTWPNSNIVWSRPMVVQRLSDGGAGSIAGDRWTRRDTPTTSLQRDYVCTTGGYPAQQVWAGIL